MTAVHSDTPNLRKPLRLWPGIVAVTLQWIARFAVPLFAPDAVGLSVMGGLAGGLAVVLWWLFFSRAPWPERVGAVALMTVAMAGTYQIAHESIAKGAQGGLLVLLAIPVLSLAFVICAAATRHFSAGARRLALAATILLACGGWALVRTGGLSGSFDNDLDWRWAKTPEERLLERASKEPAPPPRPPESKTAPVLTQKPDQPAAKVVESPATTPVREPASAKAEWPGFRGPRRDAVVPGVRIETNWAASPPAELWRRPVGPGWSSLAVDGDLLYTQEQRGPDEVVACYRIKSGDPVWIHRDAARFWESNGGPGPRGTPTVSKGRVYSLGATGILNALNASDGAVVWSRNAASDTETKVPGWGFSSSPLVVDDVVVIAASGQLAAYEIATGALRWKGPEGGGSYSSPHLLTRNGVTQILLMNAEGALSVSPSDGKLLWKHLWAGYPIVQPAEMPDGDLLISTSGAAGGIGTRRIGLTHGAAGWSVAERWTSIGLKPYFSHFVVHKGHAFGFDGSILACIDLNDGKRKWKGGRYGHGQLVVLPDQDMLLVLSEEGELALVSATTGEFKEIARFKALEGKTWNSPVLVGDTLLTRNGEEMAAFRLSSTHR